MSRLIVVDRGALVVRRTSLAARLACGLRLGRWLWVEACRVQHDTQTFVRIGLGRQFL
jgi:hypothetical protein